jgi:hypothetical protein
MKKKKLSTFFVPIFCFIAICFLIATPFRVPQFEDAKYTEYKERSLKEFFDTIPRVIYYERVSYKFKQPEIGDIVIIDRYVYYPDEGFYKEIGQINNIVFIDNSSYYYIDSINHEYGGLSPNNPVDSSFIVGKVYYPKPKNEKSGIVKKENIYPILNKIKNLTNNSTDLSKPSNVFSYYMWWVSKDKLSIFIEDAQTIQFVIPVHGETPPSRNKYWAQENIVITTKFLGQIFEKEGFKVNSLNSSNSIEDNKYYDYIQAYEKDDIKCILELNGDIESYEPSRFGFSPENRYYAVNVYIKCVENNNFNEAYSQQSKFLKDLNLKNEVVDRINQIGNFARLSIHARRSGYYMIVKLINGKWIEVFAGQDFPPCDVLDKYKVPKEIESGCFDTYSNQFLER